MTPIQCKRYSPMGSDPVVIAERVTHWYALGYHSSYSGTVVVLDTGKEVTIGDYAEDFKRMFMAAVAKDST